MHRRSVVGVALNSWYCAPAVQMVWFAHTVSVLVPHPASRKDVLLQVEQAVQTVCTRFSVSHGVEMNCPLPQLLHPHSAPEQLRQTRFCSSDGAVTWISFGADERHVYQFSHTRLLVALTSTLIYWPASHEDTRSQTRFVVAVGAVFSYWIWGMDVVSHVCSVEHTRNVVAVAAAVSYCSSASQMTLCTHGYG